MKLIQIYSLLKSTLEYRRNKNKFRIFEFGSAIIDPLRIDGSECISIHKYVTIQRQTWLYAKGLADNEKPELVFNEGCAIGYFNHIAAVKSVVFGKNVLTANNVYISDNIHDYKDILRPIKSQPIKFKKAVSIGEGTWIGEHVCVIGAQIGKNCVIGANAVVTKDIPDYCVAVGVPARVVKRYNKNVHEWQSV
jgi:acetyltransferase-like isoleucine patch superfamily enzyme